MEKDSKKTKEEKKGIKVYLPLILVVALVLGGCWYWYYEYSKYIATDDAHVDSDNVSVSSKILGRIAHLYVNEDDTVKQGTLVAELDSTDLLAQKKQVIAQKKQAEATLQQAEAKYSFDQESIKVQEVNVQKAQEDFDRAKSQFAGDVISKEQYDHLKKAYESAQAQFETAKTQLDVSKAQITSASAAIETSQAQIDVLSTQLTNTKLYAPITGVVAKRWLLPGDIIQPGQSIFTVTNNHKMWVIVYLEETKVSQIHLGQKASFTIDAFSDVTFTGKVYSIGSNTASQFSLIPPNNASGNFTKITQRVPIKVSIDGVENGKKLSSYNILVGMSALIKIIK